MISNETNYFPILNMVYPCDFTKDAVIEIDLQYQTAYITFKDKSSMDAFNSVISIISSMIVEDYPSIYELQFICDNIAYKNNLDFIKGKLTVSFDEFLNTRDMINAYEENKNMNNKLTTIQKFEKLNDVYRNGDKGPGGAYHKYSIMLSDNNINEDVQISKVLTVIEFQKGPRNEPDSQHGVIDSDLLEIVRDRLKCFQEGDFASEYNAKALEYIELALMYLNRRVEDRIERNVLGTNEK